MSPTLLSAHSCNVLDLRAPKCAMRKDVLSATYFLPNGCRPWKPPPCGISMSIGMKYARLWLGAAEKQRLKCWRRYGRFRFRGRTPNVVAKYTVEWDPGTEAQFTECWLEADSLGRDNLSAVANWIDAELATN